jgi:hypothetical protein
MQTALAKKMTRREADVDANHMPNAMEQAANGPAIGAYALCSNNNSRFKSCCYPASC